MLWLVDLLRHGAREQLQVGRLSHWSRELQAPPPAGQYLLKAAAPAKGIAEPALSRRNVEGEEAACLGLAGIDGSGHWRNEDDADRAREESLRGLAFAVPIETGFITGLC